MPVLCSINITCISTQCVFILFADLQRAQSSWPSFHTIQNLVNPVSMNNPHNVPDNGLVYNNIPQNLIPSPKQTPLLSAINGDNMSLFPQVFGSETRYASSQYPYRANATSSPSSTANVTSPSLGLFSSNAGLDANQNIVNGGLTHMSNSMNMLNNQVTSSMVNSTNGLFTTTTALSDHDLLNHVTSTSPKGMYQHSSQTSGNALSPTQSTVYSNIGNTYPLLRPTSGLMNPALGLHDVGGVKLPSGGVTYTDLTNSTNINGYAYSPKSDPTAHTDLSKVSDVMNQIDDLSHARIKLESEAARSTSPKVWRPY